MNRQPLKWPTPQPHYAIRIARFAATIAVVVLLVAAPEAAFAAAPAGTVLAAESIGAVLGNIRAWVMGFLAAWATLCATVGFLRYTSGEPGEVERGKTALRSAAIGYAGALLIPLLLTIVTAWTK
ncbi:hypothetical protein FB565_002947 [Actinoplanes lutulentus]|uniref:TrbC/VIRB2 family protein n=1 Tax=Actinoplanes lutulentus TaxID=1287878 RepID=A0A327Z1J4_9ACTN|nr:pilin [Actinoplanes lutulentus]MBB2943234.1 hypothetical protein [Actinoplanes lutulentus]RAK28295.1 hypothetical protein B0I29_12063 [Actinoplanes lutulentus]